MGKIGEPEHKEIWRKKLDVRCIKLGLGMVERRVLDLLVSHSDERTRRAWPSQDLLALRAPAARQRVNTALKTLRERELIRTEFVQQGRVRRAEHVIADTSADGDPEDFFAERVTASISADPWRHGRRERDRVTDDDTVVGAMALPVSHDGVAENDTVHGVSHDDTTDGVTDDDKRCRRGRHHGVTDDDQKYPSEVTNEAPHSSPAAVVPPSSAPPGEVLALVSAKGSKPRAATRAKAPAPKLPFRALDVCAELHRVAPQRFPAVEARDIGGGHAIAIEKVVRAFPDLAEWAAVGELLAAGWLAFRDDLGVKWLAGGARDALCQARAWKRTGVLPGGARPGPKRGPAPVSREFATTDFASKLARGAQ